MAFIQPVCLPHISKWSSYLCFFFLHSVIMFDLYLNNFYAVASSVLAADWPPTALLVSHSNSCRWPFFFFFWSGRAFFYTDKTIIALQGSSYMALTCVEPDKIDLKNKYIFACSHKKATKRAILFAVMNNEAPVITSDSERARCVRPHIQQQHSVASRICNKSKSDMPRSDTRTCLNHRVIAFFFLFSWHTIKMLLNMASTSTPQAHSCWDDLWWCVSECASTV